MERPVLPSTKTPWFRYPEDLDPVLRDIRDNLDVLDSDVDDIQSGDLPIALAGIEGALGQWTGAVNVLSEGADPTGVGDSSTAIAASLDTGRAVTIPPGDFRVTEQFAAANPRLIGAGSDRTTLIVPDGFDLAVFDLDDADHAHLSGFTIRPEIGGTAGTLSFGIRIHGNSRDVVIEDVVGDGMATAVQIGKRDTVADGLCQSIHLVRVRGINSPSTFGICIDDCDGVSLWDCAGVGNWLDGLKLRADTRNVEIYGGNYSGNGIAWPTNGSATGDGIDAFPGGDTFLIVGGRYNDNYGNGITIKTDIDVHADESRSEYVRNVRVIAPSACNNMVHGVTFYTFASSGDIADIPMAAHATIQSPYAEGNGVDGIYLNGRSVVVSSPISRLNERHGIMVDAQSRYTQITDPMVSANSQAGAGTHYGIYIMGKHTRVRGGAVLGVDADDIKSGTDLSSLTKYHLQNILVHGNAEDTEIDGVSEGFNTTGPGLRCNQNGGRCIINQSNDGSPLTTSAYGSIGSEYIQKDATAGADVVWRKVRGQPNQPTTGWRRQGNVRPIITTTLDRSATEADLGSLLIVTSGSGKTVFLPTAVGLAGDGLTIKQGGAGAITIDPAGTETINGLATATVTGFAEVVSDGANWHVVAGAVA